MAPCSRKAERASDNALSNVAPTLCRRAQLRIVARIRAPGRPRVMQEAIDAVDHPRFRSFADARHRRPRRRRRPRDDVAKFYKGKTVQAVVGYGPGSTFELYLRLLTRHIGKHIPGNPNVVVQQMPGAGSLKATNYLAAVAPKDGSVFGMINPVNTIEPLIDPEEFALRPAHLRLARQPQLGDLHLRVLEQGHPHVRRSQEARDRVRLDRAGVRLHRRCQDARRAGRAEDQGRARLSHAERHPACRRARRDRRLLRAARLRAQDRLLGGSTSPAAWRCRCRWGSQSTPSCPTSPTPTSSSKSRRRTASCSS